MRQELLDHYLDCLAGLIDLDRSAFMEHYYAYVYVRILQALGAYGFRGFYERKAALSAKRAVCAEELALAGGECEASDCAAGADGGAGGDWRRQKNCRESCRS